MPAGRIAVVCASLLIVAAIITFAPPSSRAAEVQFNLFSIEGFVIGDTFSIDADYGAEYGVPIPAPFKFLIPREDGVIALFETPTAPGGMLIKVNFGTEEREFIENLQFITLTLPMGERDERLTNLARLLANDGYNQVVANYPENEYIGARETKVGDYDAVEVLGKYIDPQWGLMYLRIVGIPNPNAAESVWTVANVAAERVALESIDDLARTRSGTALRFFEYVGE